MSEVRSRDLYTKAGGLGLEFHVHSPDCRGECVPVGRLVDWPSSPDAPKQEDVPHVGVPVEAEERPGRWRRCVVLTNPWRGDDGDGGYYVKIQDEYGIYDCRVDRIRRIPQERERGEVVLEVGPDGFEFVGAGYRVNTTCLGIPEGRYRIVPEATP